MNRNQKTWATMLLVASLSGFFLFTVFLDNVLPQIRHYVGAYYYSWSYVGQYNMTDREYTPIAPFHNGSSSQAMNLSIRLAHESLIDFFAFSYWSPQHYDEALTRMFQINKDLGSLVKICCMIEYYNGATNDNPNIDLHVYADHIYAQFASNPSYFVWENKPLLLIYTKDYAPPAWTDLRFSVRFVPIQVPYSTSTTLRLDALAYLEFQGVFPGFNNMVWGSPKTEIPRAQGEFYRSQWRQAMTISKIAKGNTCCMITSWNEFPEQTAIAPSLQAGNLYLNITREYAAKYKEG